MPMPRQPSWEEIGPRLLATLVAAGIIGLNREVRGHPAGLRITTLVSLVAALAMTQANILLPKGGAGQLGGGSSDPPVDRDCTARSRI